MALMDYCGVFYVNIVLTEVEFWQFACGLGYCIFSAEFQLRGQVRCALYFSFIKGDEVFILGFKIRDLRISQCTCGLLSIFTLKIFIFVLCISTMILCDLIHFLVEIAYLTILLTYFLLCFVYSGLYVFFF